jgi:hypothetical protein
MKILAQTVLRFWALLIAASCVAQPLRAPIVAIDFYGAARVDYTRLRTAIAFQVGDVFAAGQTYRERLPGEYQKLIGKNRISYAPVFIPDLKGWVVYVDVEPPETSSVIWNPAPTESDKLPARIVRMYEHAMDQFINGGINAGDEITNGYSLSKDPIMRSDELKLIAYARSHPGQIYSVLKRSASASDRIAAAWIAGYAPQGPDQLAALLHAVKDPDSTVRNNAIRVLAVLATHDRAIARQIPADPFIPMLHSLTWTDRNKAMFLLDPVTAARDSQTIESLRRQAVVPLRQMARWTYWGHASMALVLLGRIAGIPEARLQHLLQTRNAAAILDQVPE